MTKKYIIYTFCCFLFKFYFFSQVLFAQSQLRFEHYNQSSGISQGTGYSIAQYDNYMWFGTSDGLNRFDGYNFKVYRKDGKNGLNNSFCEALLADSHNRFWIGTGKGITLYDNKTDKFIGFNTVFGLNHILGGNLSIKKLLEDKQGIIWIMTDGAGVYSFNPKTKKIKRFLATETNLTDFICDDWGDVWISSTSEVYHYSTKNNSLKAINIKKTVSAKTPITIYSLLVHQQQLWIGTYSTGIYVCDINQKTTSAPLLFREHYTVKELNSGDVTSMKKDHNGLIWIGTRMAGVTIFNTEKKTFTNNFNTYYDNQSIADNHIWTLFEDQQGIMWLGLSSKGIDKYDPLKYRFNLIRHDYLRADISLSDNMIFKILGQKDELYVGTSVKVNRYNLNTKIVTPLFPSNKNQDNSYVNEVRTMSEDRQHNIWMMNWQGLCQYNPTKKTFIIYPLPQKSAIYLYDTRFLEQKQEIWVGGNAGLSIFDLKTKRWKETKDDAVFKVFSDQIVRLFYEDKQNNIWLGTLGSGLFRYTPATQQLLNFNKYNVCQNIRSIFEDGNILWVGGDCGLIRINLTTLKVERFYAEKEGLPNNVVYSILKDEEGFLWLSTNKGLAKFSPQKGIVVKTFDINDGLQSDEFNTNCAYRHPDGTMFFGGVDGITYFKPKEVKENNFIAPVKITQIKVLDSLYESNLSELILEHYQNFINFEFVAFNYSNTSKNTYQYHLDGIDKNWINAGTQNHANYTNLPYGDYVFRVKGFNNDGIQNPKETILKITIKPSTTQSWWFKTLISLSVFMLSFWFYRNRITTQNLKLDLENQEAKSKQNEAEMKETEAIFKQKIAETEISALRSQMNPHFIFNCLNSIKLYSLENNSQAASDFLTKFSRLIRMVLENSRSEKVTLENELETLELYIEMEAMRFKDKVKYQINIAKNIDQQFIEIPPLLLQPFVENSIWHGLMHKTEGGTVKIDISQTQEQILNIEISDDGVGREKAIAYKSKSAMKNKSLGMKVTSERIELINQIYKTNTQVEIIDLKDQNGNAIGTRVILNIPI